jgi:glutaredoxin
MKLSTAYRLAALVTALTIGLPAPATDIHKWRDQDGRTHFGDRPPSDTTSTVVTVKTNVYTSPTIEARSNTATDAEAQVVMYSASWCGYCRKAREYFNSHQVAFSEYDIGTSEKGQRDYQQLGARGVPVILVGEQRLNGFTLAAFESIYQPR